jgi:hypothetical protein
MTLTLTQPEGGTTVGGTVVTSYGDSQFLETITTGTQNGLLVELETVIYDAKGTPFYYRYHGLTEADGTAMHGTSDVVGAGACCTWSVRR